MLIDSEKTPLENSSLSIKQSVVVVPVNLACSNRNERPITDPVFNFSAISLKSTVILLFSIFSVVPEIV